MAQLNNNTINKKGKHFNYENNKIRTATNNSKGTSISEREKR